MGTTTLIGYSRHELVEMLIQDEPRNSFKCVKKFFSGNDLWTLWQRKGIEQPGPHDFTIRLDRMLKVHGGWAYRDFGEADHPYVYSCPLVFLEYAEVKDSDWRLGVVRYWEERNAKTLARRRRRAAEIDYFRRKE